jgi:CDP-paratose 2-epimerase
LVLAPVSAAVKYSREQLLNRYQPVKILITGICGFVGSALAEAISQAGLGWNLVGVDNFVRAGSGENRLRLARLGVKVFAGDLRNPADLEALPAADWVVDAAAHASVLAGADGVTSSRQLVEHNLIGTINALEYCKQRKAGLILLSTSRVYAIPPLAQLAVDATGEAFAPTAPFPTGLSPEGITEAFSTDSPRSLYGATKLASEVMALEYSDTFNFPVWINRCGVMAGAGQFGRPDQGIFSYWIHAHRQRRPLRYIGFDGQGRQVRDCLHPRDLLSLLRQQIAGANPGKPRIANVSGGRASAMSLRQLTAWCDARFGPHPVASDPRPRPFDLPWVVLDSAQARAAWDWQPATKVTDILEEIARHAEARPDWLEVSEA